MADGDDRITSDAADDAQWKATLRKLAETRRKERADRWKEALEYYRQVTSAVPEGSDFRKPVTLDELLGSIDEQHDKYDERRGRPEEPLTAPKKKHRLMPWRSKKEDAVSPSRDKGDGSPWSADGASGSAVDTPKPRTVKRQLIDKVKITFGPLELFGRMTVDTFGAAYPGVAYAFGAVFFLIQTARGVSELYNSIQEFFGLIKPFLDRMAVYSQRELSPELDDLITDFLISIIRINGIASEIVSRNRATQFFRVVIGKDERITKELATLRDLFDNEGRMVSALVLREVQERMAKPAPVPAQVQRPGHDMKARLAELKANLRPVTAKGAPENVLRSNKMRRAADTGTWILSEQAFKAWLEHESPVLWISGGPGAGKTFLSCFIVQHLLDTIQGPVDDGSRASLAYFFCKDDVPELRSFDAAIRTMSYQICTKNAVYAEHVSSTCPESSDLDAETLWLKLFNDYFQKPPEYSDYTPASTDVVYVLIDGLDETDTKERRSFLKTLSLCLKKRRTDMNRIRVQMLLLGRPELTPELEAMLGKDLLAISVTAQKNSADIERFVRESMDDGRLSDVGIPEKHQQDFIERLSQSADGMFLWADLMIDEMAMKDDFQDMQQALQKAPLELSGKILNSLDQFGKTLDKDKIADLNVMLSWVTCAQRRLTMAELKGILRKLRNGASNASMFEIDFEEEMFQFESSLRKRYSSLFTLLREDGLSTEDLRSMLAQREGSNKSHGDEAKEGKNKSEKAKNPQTNKSKLRMMSSPTTEVVIAHSSIKEFFQCETKTTKVGVNVSEAHASMALNLLEIICDLGSKEDSLFAYACNEWQRHLGLAKLSRANGKEQKKIRSFILKLFRDRDISRRWVSHVGQFWLLWIWSRGNQTYVQGWLQHADFTSELNEGTRSWVQNLGEDPSDHLLRLPYEICATEWLKKYDWMAPPCFVNVAWYMEMILCIERGEYWPYEAGKPDAKSIEYIRQVAQWTEFEQNAVYHSRLGFTLRQLNLTQGAIEDHETALQKDNQCIPSLAGLAYCYEDEGDLPKAVECMSKVMNSVKTRSNAVKIPERTVERYLNDLGEWQAKVNNEEEARCAWEQLRGQSTSNTFAATNLLNLLYAQGKYSEMVSVLDDLVRDSPPGQKHNCLTQLCLQWYSGGDEQLPYCPGIEDAALREGRLDIIRDMYASAVDAAERIGDMTLVLLLKIDLAQILYRYYERDGDAIEALKEVIRIHQGKAGTKLHMVRTLASHRLQEIYVQQAAASEDKSYISKLIADFEALVELDEPDSANSVHRFCEPDDPMDCARLRLGSLYTMTDRRDEAMAHLKGNLQLGLDLLADKRSLDAFQCLMRVFLSARDDVNALAAFSKLSHGEMDPPNTGHETAGTEPDAGAPEPSTPAATVVVVQNANLSDGTAIEVAKTDVSADADPSQLDSVALRLSRNCDGCGFESGKPDGFFHCRSCTDIDWCADCMPKLQSGELKIFPPRKCDRKHYFLRIPEWEDTLEKSKVRVGTEQLEIETWVRQIKADWGLLDKS